MRSFSIPSVLAAAAATATGALALVPNGTEPAVNATLGVAYNSTIVDGTKLFAPATLQHQPNVSYAALNDTMMMNTTMAMNSTSMNSTYMVFMIDLSLPTTQLASVPAAQIVPGAGMNRTTRLHWWAGNLTSVDMSAAAMSNTSNLTTAFTSFLVNSSRAVAAYQAPAPPAGDIAHYYTFYLFDQPMNYTLPANALAGNFSGYGDGRANFNITPVVEAAGQPLAATYLLAQNNATGVTNITMANMTMA